MAGGAQGDCAKCGASSSRSRSHHNGRHWPLGRNSIRVADVRVELRPVDVGDAGEIERALAAFAGSPNGGLILTGSALALAHRDLIIALAARYRLPAVYYERYFAAAGGL